MAASNTPAHGRPDDDGDRETLQPDSQSTVAPARALQELAFWSAVVLPFLHVPLLATGLSTAAERTAFGALLALNAVALYAGHAYGAS